MLLMDILKEFLLNNETQQIIENPTISKYTTNKTAVFDVYFVDGKIHINGHGYDDYIFQI